MTEKEMKNFSVDDLGTQKDSQYRRAEGTLVRQLQKAQAVSTFQPGKANLSYCLLYTSPSPRDDR